MIDSTLAPLLVRRPKFATAQVRIVRSSCSYFHRDLLACRAFRFGVGDLAFALGDDALGEFVMAIQFLPVCQMYITMCPEGTEGTTYAILTTLR